MADAPVLYYAQNVGFEVLLGNDPAAYAALNIGFEVLAGENPAAYAALNIGLESLAGDDPVLYAAQNLGDWATSKADDTLGPEFAFAPVLTSLTPAFGQEGQSVVAAGVGFGCEKVFVRWGNVGTAGGVTGGDAKAGPGTITAITAPWTIETWFRTQQQGEYNTAAGLESGELVQLLTVGDSPKYTLELTNGKVKVTGPGAENIVSAVAYDDGKWHHARVVLDSDSDLHLLVDGAPMGGSVASSDVSVPHVELAQNYRGDQRETRVMSENLGTSLFAIASLWSVTSGATTVALWHMDDNTGTTLTDSGAGSWDLTISGSDFLWTDWDFNVQVTLSGAVQGLDVDFVRGHELRWTVAVGAASGPVIIKHTVKHIDQSDPLAFTVLPAVTLRGAGIEVRIYDKDNFATLLTILENAFGVSFTIELDGPGAGSFKLNLNDPKATSANLKHGNLVRVYLDQVERFAFRIERLEEALVEAEDASSQIATVEGRGVLSMLDDAIVYPPSWPTTTPLETVYASKTLGHIIDNQVTKALARGALSGVTTDFTSAVDSDGVGWADVYSLSYFPGHSLRQMVEQATGLGLDVRMTSALVLQLYEQLGLDRTTGDDPMIFAQGDNLIIDMRDASSSEIKNAMLVLRNDGIMEQSQSSDFSRRESFMDARQTSDLSTAQQLALKTLDTLGSVSDAFTAEVLSVQDHSEAFVDWDLGDFVLVDVRDLGERQTYRVRSITVEQTGEDRLRFTASLGSLRHEYLVRLKKMLDTFTGGTLTGSTGGGTIGTITPNLVNLYLNAPSDSQYLLLAADISLPSSRKFVAGSGLAGTDGGAGGNFTLDLSVLTENWDAGSFKITALELATDTVLLGAASDVAIFRGIRGGVPVVEFGVNDPLSLISTVSAMRMVTIQRDADSDPRFTIRGSGDLEWGSGAAAADITLGRGAADRLDLASGDSLRLVSGDIELVEGRIDAAHVASESDDHAVELDVDAAGKGDVKALDIAYITGAISAGDDEGIILINIDEIASGGGDVFALEVLATEGSATVHGMKVGALVAPVHHDSGTFANPTTGTNDTPGPADVAAMIDGNSGTTTSIFVAEDDYILIGADDAFEEIEFILTVGSSGAGIKPTFWYSTAGAHQFTQFNPVDGTNAFRNTGVVAWDQGDLTNHAVNTDTGTFDIKVIRTRESLGTTPVLGFAKTAATTEYIWDKDGNLNILKLLTDTIVENTPDSGVTIEGVKALDSFVEFVEIAAPSNPAANKLRVFAEDVGGVTGLSLLDSAGVKTQIVARTRRMLLVVRRLADAATPSTAYADAASTANDFQAPVPADWVPGTDIILKIELHQLATAGSPTAVFRSSIGLASEGEAVSRTNFENAVNADIALTQNLYEELSRTITAASIAADDGIFWRLLRLGGDGSDAVNGSVNNDHGVWMEYTAFF